jgi:tetratricopeptide (TPR) repeat protein
MHLTRHIDATLVLCSLVLGSSSLSLRAQSVETSVSKADPHSTAEWAMIAPHLPDPVSGSPVKLEMAGDVLRARRYPEDAMTFYKAAMNNGGDLGRLLKKEGVVHLEMQQGLLARLNFQQATRLNKKDAEAWNNMGAADFMLGNPASALSEYKRAVKLNRSSAVFHSNLALAYFEVRDGQSARRELARAFALDPDIMHHSESGGYNLQVLASAHYAEICFEMAHVYAAQGDRETTITWLTKASERGFNVRSAMKGDPLLEPYLQDDRVKVMLANSDQRHSKDLSAKVKAPSLGEAGSRP